MTASVIRAAPPAPAPSSTAADWLAGTAIIVIAPLLRELPLWVSIGYLAAVSWRFIHTHWRWPQPGRWLRGALAILCVISVYRYFGSVLGREPGVSLLVLLTGLKLLELRAVRDAVLAAMLLLLVVLGGFLFDNSLLLGIYTLFSVVTVTAALVRLQNPSLAPLAVARLAAMLVVQALPLMLVAYLLFPRLPDAIWGIQSSDTTATTGMPEEMQPGAITSLTLSDAVAFRAYFEGTPPPNSALYWRVRVFWDTDGFRWNEGPQLPARNLLRGAKNPVDYRLVLEPGNNAWVPALDMPFAAPRELRQRAGFVYEMARTQRERQTYDFRSYLQYRTGALDDARRTRALALPAQVSDRVRTLAASWRADARTDGDIVRAAMRHFNTQPFYYSLKPPRLTRDPVDQFLFESRRGFCEHYAAAFVTLLRAAGVPARVVVGYQGGVFNETGNYFIVRQADAHAWAEVWLADRGWTRVDPTAAVALSRIEYGIDGIRRLNSQGLPLNTVAADIIRRAFQLPWLERARLRARLTWDYLNFAWYLWVGDYSLQRQTEFLAQVGLTNWSVPAMVAILAQLVFIYALLQLRRRRASDPLVVQYEKYCGKLKRIGVAREAAEGPLALSRRARLARPELSSSIDAITRLYVSLRYGQTTKNADNLRALSRAIGRFRPARR